MVDSFSLTLAIFQREVFLRPETVSGDKFLGGWVINNLAGVSKLTLRLHTYHFNFLYLILLVDMNNHRFMFCNLFFIMLRVRADNDEVS